MMPPDQHLDAPFKRPRVWRDLMQRAERESWSYRDVLALRSRKDALGDRPVAYWCSMIFRTNKALQHGDTGPPGRAPALTAAQRPPPGGLSSGVEPSWLSAGSVKSVATTSRSPRLSKVRIVKG